MAGEKTRSGAGHAGAAAPGRALAMLVLLIGSCAALSIDIPRAGYGIKGDEATYVSMGLSLAHDGDLAFDRGDLERFYAVYHAAPEGIFLKQGVTASYRFDSAFPFVVRETTLVENPDRVYYGKSYISSVFAAPFVRLFGLNGFLVFHVVLLSLVVWLGSVFLAAHSMPGAAAAYAVVFVGASVVPIYGVWLTPEIFNLSAVFLAYFLWFYKEVAPPATTRLGRFARGPASDIAAAIVLGLATFSKPIPNGLLLLPPVGWAISRRDVRSALVIGTVCAVVVAGSFAVNASISGEFNYQGGRARSTYYSRTQDGRGGFPFEDASRPLDRIGIARATNEVVIEERLDAIGFARQLGHNLRYFLIGRHFGFVPFFFPGVVSVLLFLVRTHERDRWKWMVFGTAVLSAVTLVIYMPYTWSGGGGPSGNRYYLSAYPVLFFLTPSLGSMAAPAAAAVGGMAFIGHVLVNPLVSAKEPYRSVEQGVLRQLPVELTMVNDLPIMLDASRARIPFGEVAVPRASSLPGQPADVRPLLIYYLDHNAWLPEPPGIWVSGGTRADLIVRKTGPEALARVDVTLRSPVDNTVHVELGGDEATVALAANRPETVTLEPSGVYARRSWAYVLSVSPERGFVPLLRDGASVDRRYLGVAVNLSATAVPSTGGSE